jgi:hypothetical protein
MIKSSSYSHGYIVVLNSAVSDGRIYSAFEKSQCTHTGVGSDVDERLYKPEPV